VVPRWGHRKFKKLRLLLVEPVRDLSEVLVIGDRDARYGPGVPPRDTSPAAHEAQMECYRRMTPAARIAAAVEMSEDVRAIAAAGIRARHPSYTPGDVRHALHRLILGDDLFRRAWPHAPILPP
jgi:hypothetical protein